MGSWSVLLWGFDDTRKEAKARYDRLDKKFPRACSNCGEKPRNGDDYYCSDCRREYRLRKSR